MANQTGAHINQSSYSKEEHDGEYGKHRVIGRVDGNSVSYEDQNFTALESPAVLAVETDLGKRAYKGYLLNEGPGDILIEVSNIGVVYGGQHTIRSGEQFSFDDLNVSKVRLTFVDPTQYRALLAG